MYIKSTIQVFGRLTVFVLAVAQTSLSYADLFVPDGLQAGDAYQLTFVTGEQHNAQRDDIEFHNGFVRFQTTSGPTLPCPDEDVIWNAIDSTQTVNARDNGNVHSTQPMGTNSVIWGNNRHDAEWTFACPAFSLTRLLSGYALKENLTVPKSVPEPSSLSAASGAGLTLAIR